jgi:hypothetical protein
VAEDPAILWDRYMQLTQIEAGGCIKICVNVLCI